MAQRTRAVSGAGVGTVLLAVFSLPFVAAGILFAVVGLTTVSGDTDDGTGPADPYPTGYVCTLNPDSTRLVCPRDNRYPDLVLPTSRW